MTREEQIKQANPMRLSPSEYEEWNKGDTIYNYRASYSEGFKDGAQWADSHPNWHKFPDEKPDKSLIPIQYLVWIKDSAYTASWNGHTFYDSIEDWICNKFVEAWMEFPEPPKF